MDKLDIVNEFKNEYKASSYYIEHLSKLKNDLYVLDCQFEPKSPSLSGLRYSSVPRDVRLAKYATKRDRILKYIAQIEGNLKRINGVLNCIDEEYIRKSIEAIYKDKNTISSVAYKVGYSPKQLQRKIDTAIYEAVQIYENLI